MSKQEKTLTKVERSPAGLRNALFDELDALRAGQTDVVTANATARLAEAIVSTVRIGEIASLA